MAEGIRIPSDCPVPPGPLVRDAAQAYIREHPQEVIAAVLDPESPALAPGPSLWPGCISLLSSIFFFVLGYSTDNLSIPMMAAPSLGIGGRPSLATQVDWVGQPP